MGEGDVALMALSPVFVELKANVGDLKSKLADAEKDIEKLSKKGGSNFDKLAAGGKGALLGLGTVAVGVGGFALKMASDWTEAHDQLETAVRNSGGSIDDIKGKVKSLDGQMEKYGFTNTQTEQALSHLVTATNDPKKALGEMGLAADIAKARNLDLSTSSDLLAKAMAGNLRPLKQMGIDLPITATNALKLQAANDAVTKAQDKVNEILAKTPDAANKASKAHAAYEQALGHVKDAQKKLSDEQSASGQVLDALTQRFGGSAANSAKTFHGKIEALKAKSQDLGKELGLKLIPVVTKLASVTMDVVQWFDKHKAAAIALGVIVGGVLLAAITAYIVQLGIAAVETITAAAGAVAAFAAWAVSALAAAGTMLVLVAPILLIVAAVALLGLGIYELVTHWKQVWGDIKQWTSDAWHAIEPTLKLIGEVLINIATGGLFYLATHWKEIWEDIKRVTSEAWKAIKDFFTKAWEDIKQIVTDGVKAVINFFVGLPGKIIDAIGDLLHIGAKIAGDIAQAVSNDVHKIWDWFKDLPKNIIGAIGDLGHIGKKIVQDIVNGIGSMGSAIADKLKSLIPGGGVLGGVLHSLNPFKHAAGAFVTSPEFALIGEAGPEVVLPLSNPGRTLQLAQQSGLFDVLARAMGGVNGLAGAFGAAQSGVQTNNINVNMPAGVGGGGNTTNNIQVVAMTDSDANEIAHEIAWHLNSASAAA